MFYSEEFVEEVRQRNDIVDVISSCVHLKRSGSNYTGLCPFHNEKTPSFSVSPGKQMYYCFGCGAGGNVFTFLMEYENLSFVEALEQLAERAGMALPDKSEDGGEARRKKNLRDNILEVYKVAARYYYALLKSEQGKDAYEYLKRRELSDDTITKFGLGYSGKSGGLYRYLKSQNYKDELLKQTGLFTYDEKRGAYDKFWNRVMYPIMDRSNKVIAFSGRVMGDALPKYLNSPETLVFDKSRNLYGLNFVRGKTGGMILCEGYMDVIALHQAGFTNAVASLGTAFTSQHSSLLKRYTDLVYLCYDSDGAGVKAALRAIPILKEAGIRVKVIDMQPYKDPDEFMKALSPEEFQKRIDHAKSSFFFEIDMLKREYDMNDPEEKTKFINEAAKKCLTFDNELERNNYIEAFARQYEIRMDDFKQLVVALSAKMSGVVFTAGDRMERKRETASGEDGTKQAERMLLTWLSDDVGLFRILEGIIDETDFTEEPYRQVASMLYEQYRLDGKVYPAKIISCFESKEEQSLVASLFNTTIQSVEEKEREKALNDIVFKVKKNSLDFKSSHMTDLSELTKLIADKKKLENMHISLANG